MAENNTNNSPAKKTTRRSTTAKKTAGALRAGSSNGAAKKPARKTAKKASTVTKKATRSATQNTTSAKRSGRTSTRGSKGPAKKVATKKTTTTVAHTNRQSHDTNGSEKFDVRRVAGKVQTLAGEALHGTALLAKDGVHVATGLAHTAKEKAQRLTQKGKRFVQEHPAEAAGLAAAGLTVIAAALGRKKLAPVVKGVVATGLAAKATDAVRKLTKR